MNRNVDILITKLKKIWYFRHCEIFSISINLQLSKFILSRMPFHAQPLLCLHEPFCVGNFQNFWHGSHLSTWRYYQIADLVKLTENTYTKEDMLNMEIKILAVLKFQITFCDPHTLMEKYLTIAGCHKDKMVSGLRWNNYCSLWNANVKHWYRSKYNGVILTQEGTKCESI